MAQWPHGRSLARVPGEGTLPRAHRRPRLGRRLDLRWRWVSNRAVEDFPFLFRPRPARGFFFGTAALISIPAFRSCALRAHACSRQISERNIAKGAPARGRLSSCSRRACVCSRQATLPPNAPCACAVEAAARSEPSPPSKRRWRRSAKLSNKRATRFPTPKAHPPARAISNLPTGMTRRLIPRRRRVSACNPQPNPQTGESGPKGTRGIPSHKERVAAARVIQNSVKVLPLLYLPVVTGGWTTVRTTMWPPAPTSAEHRPRNSSLTSWQSVGREIQGAPASPDQDGLA